MQSATNLHHLCVVLVATRNPLNMGAAARAMSNFGFADLRVVRPHEAAFRDARSAVGAEALLENAQEYETLAEAVADCHLVVGTSAGTLHRETHHSIHRLEAAVPILLQAMQEQKAALLFGSEKFGLSADDISHCDWLLHIPTRAEHLSMNLGQAVALCLYELIRNESTATTPLIRQPATAAQTELLAMLTHELLTVSDYLEHRPRANRQAELRRILRRLHPGSKDAEAILGMLRQAIWKIKNPA